MIKKNTWVVFFGGAGRENIINKLVQNNFCIDTIIIPEKRTEKLNKSISYLRKHEIIFHEVSRDNIFEILKKIDALYLLSIGFPYIIPDNVLKSFKLSINVHPTLLPKYRGSRTGAWILLNGEQESGSTVHFMEKEVDTGGIIGQSRVRLNVFDTIRSMQRKVYESEPNLVVECLKKVENGNIEVLNPDYEPVFKRRTPEDSLINPQKPLIELWNEIRASDPVSFPAYFYVDGQKVCVKLWRPDKRISEKDEI